MVGDEVGGQNALIGVGEADAEAVGILHALLHGGGGGQHQDAVRLALSGQVQAAAAQRGADRAVHALVHQHVVGVDSGFGIARIVLHQELDLHAGNAAGCVDFFRGDFSAALHRKTVVRIVAGQRARGADDDGLFSAGGHAAHEDHGERENHAQGLFHGDSSIFSGVP